MIRSYKGRKVDEGKVVSVYRNLNNGLLSIRQDGLVVGHSEELYLKVGEYKVSEEGRKRVLKEKVKNVHASIEGKIISEQEFNRIKNGEGVEIYYNPYKVAKFTEKVSGEEASSELIKITSDGKMVGYNGMIRGR